MRHTCRATHDGDVKSMKRLRIMSFRRTFLAITTILALATAILWWQTYPPDHGYGLRYQTTDGRNFAVFSYHGCLLLYDVRIPTTTPCWILDWDGYDAIQKWDAASIVRDDADRQNLRGTGTNIHLLGFRLFNLHDLYSIRQFGLEPYPGPARGILLPYWSITALLTLPLAFAVWRSIKRKSHHNTGLCPICGYDLRASPTRCPECGAPNLSPRSTCEAP